MQEKVIVSWSGGKDSALALHEIKKSGDYDVVALLTTVTATYDRISMHGVRRVLLAEQARALGIALEEITISKDSSHREYEDAMRNALLKFRAAGVLSVVVGDIFLEDLRKYREENLSRIGMTGIFPLWKRNTKELAQEFIGQGFRAVITCVDSQALDKKFAGRQFDAQFLAELPASVDPCGENGEFHSFVYAGPLFKKEIPYVLGDTVVRDKRFYYTDLMAVEQ